MITPRMKTCAHEYCKKKFVPARITTLCCSRWCSKDRAAMERVVNPCSSDRDSWLKRKANKAARAIRARENKDKIGTRIRCAHRHCKKLFVLDNASRIYCSLWCRDDENGMARKGVCLLSGRNSWMKRRRNQIKRLRRKHRRARVLVPTPKLLMTPRARRLMPCFCQSDIQHATPEQASALINKIFSDDATYASTLHHKTKARV